MGDFKVPHNTRGRYWNRQEGDSCGRGSSSVDRDNSTSVNRRDARQYISSRLRTRYDSGNKEDPSERHTKNERYRAEGHLGSLRSPLRASSQSDNRTTRLKELRTRESAATRTSRTNLSRDKNHNDMRSPGKVGVFTDRRGNRSDSSSTSGDDVARLKRKTSESNSTWNSTSVVDFPPLCNFGKDDWGSRVEKEELVEELKHAKKFRLKSSASENSGSSESLNQSINKKNSDFTPKRRFTEAELGTQEIQTVMARRQKQIDYGKSTTCYDNYLRVVPRNQRTRLHPSTPDKNVNYSRRGWDMIIKIWRKKLHVWDPESKVKQSIEDDEDGSELGDISMSVLDSTVEDCDEISGELADAKTGTTE